MTQSPDATAPISTTKRILLEVRGYAEALLVAVFITTFLFTTVGVAGSSMKPNLEGGSGNLIEALLVSDRLFIPKYETWLRRLHILGPYTRGSIVIFREPEDSPYRSGRRKFLVKRVIGIPGDSVEILAGNVFINGQKLDQSFITASGGTLGNSSMTTVTVPENQYFVLGDNRNNSVDSRIFGFINHNTIAGQANAVIWPPVRDGSLNWRSLRVPDAFRTVSSN